MAERSYPFAGGPTSEAEFSAMFALLFPSSVVGYPGSTALQCFADSSGMNVKLRPGAGFNRGHRYALDAQAQYTIAANGASATRIDTLVLRLEYGTVRKISPLIVQGVAGQGAPSLISTPDGTNDFPLADISVASGAVTIAAGAVTDRRKWWSLEALRSLGVVIGTTEPPATSANVFLKR